MFQKVTSLLICLLLIPCLAFPAQAQSEIRVTDDAGLLQPEEILQLESTAANLADTYQIDAVIVTVPSLGGASAQDYADAYYDQNGYGDDGVLFLLAMAEREWYISTCGKVIYALTDYGVQQLGNGILPYLSDGDWYQGFGYFLDMLPFYLDAYEKGSSIDGFADDSGDYYHGDQEEILYYREESKPNFFLSLLCGMIVAGISLFVMRSSMNTKRARHAAGEYLVEGSWALTQHSDIFLYSNVTKTRKQEPPKNTGGGSSVHRSSGGRSHGGGGGKF